MTKFCCLAPSSFRFHAPYSVRKVCLQQECRAEVRPSEVRLTEVRLTEVRLAEVRRAEVRSAEVRVDAATAHAGRGSAAGRKSLRALDRRRCVVNASFPTRA